MGTAPHREPGEVIEILIADDDQLVRVGLRAVLDGEPDMTVVAEAGDGREAIDRAAEMSPHVVVMDIRMPNLDGLAATRQIVQSRSEPPRVLILTTFELDEYVYEALSVGASGFVLKRVPPSELIEAVRLVHTGESLVFPTATRKLIGHFARPTPPAELTRAVASLTDRERDVLAAVARGRSNREIADDLYVSSETVKSHVGSVLTKLGVRDRTQAVIAAYESGFISPGSG